MLKYIEKRKGRERSKGEGRHSPPSWTVFLVIEVSFQSNQSI
jgi:hypothetical protein